MRQLDTFVDLKGKISDLNIMQQKKVRLLIDHLKHQAQSKKMFDNQNDLKNNLKIYGEQLELELDVLQHIDNDDNAAPAILDLVHLKFAPKQISAMIHESSALLTTHYNIHKLKEKIKQRSQPRIIADQILSSMSKIDILGNSNSDEQNFYKAVLQNPHHKIPVVVQDPMTAAQKYKYLIRYLKQRGIEIDSKEIIPQNRYHKDFKSRSDKLIKDNKEQQLKKYSKFAIMTSSGKFNTQTTTMPSITDIPRTHRSPLNRQADTRSKFQEFFAKTQAFDQFFQSQNQEYFQKLEQLSEQVEQPMKRHFDDFIQMKYDKQDLEKTDIENDLLKNKGNQRKKLRMHRIFKSELS